MKGVFERALGTEFDRLHPAIQERFGITSDDGRRCVGRGRMATVYRNPVAVPVLRGLAREHVLFPEQGSDVAFEVRTYPFRDADGTETVAYVRQFETGPTRRFDAFMTYDGARDCVVDYLGRHRRLVSELTFEVTDDGELAISAGGQWLELGGRTVPLPAPLRANVVVTEGYDAVRDRFTIQVRVTNPLVGEVFGYTGEFTVEYEDCPSLRPEDAPAGWEGSA